MIVSHKYKFIFIAIPKTATHALRHAIRPQLDEGDWEQVELFHSSRLPYTAFSTLTHGHISARAAKKELGNEIWNSYFKFAIVRNPFDRFISYSFFRNDKSEIFKMNSLAKMKLSFQDPTVLTDLLFTPQLDFISNNDGEVIVDFVGRFEDLQQSFNTVCKRTGLQKSKLQNYNTSAHKNYKDYYDEELKNLVNEFYQKEIDLFQYNF